jgi:site-specific DNA-adenine methylase
MTTLSAPLTYQGGKQRIASQILDRIKLKPDQYFYDLCCGSGAISVELINRGHPPEKITMLDVSPWGLFWQMIGNGSFDFNKFVNYCHGIPKDRSQIKTYMQGLFDKSVDNDAVYVFLLLQASTFGGAAVWIKDQKWMKSGGFRNYWMPTETSNRRHPVNPMMPLPDTLLERISDIRSKMKGVNGIHSDINTISPNSDGVIYIDPPYGDTAFYGYTFDILAYARNTRNKCYVSESKPLSETVYLICNGRKKGGMSGERKSLPHEEWLSEFGEK